MRDFDDRYDDLPPIKRGNSFDRFMQNRSQQSSRNRDNYEDDFDNQNEYENKVNINTATKTVRRKPKVENTVSLPPSGLDDSNVIIYSPKEYKDVQHIIDYLKRREAVIADLNNIADESAQRILDMLSGAVYGLSGSIQRIQGALFLLTPAGVSIKAPNIRDYKG